MKGFSKVTCAIVLFALSGCGMVEERLGPVAPGDLVSASQDLYKAASLTDEEVVSLSHQIALESDRKNKIAGPTSVYHKRLAKVIAAHKSEDGLSLNYKVYLNDEINAFSLADGSIRINSALMDLLGDRELISVIGHEIGHIKLGHAKAELQRGYAAAAALKTAGSSIRGGMGNSLGGVAGAIGAEVFAEVAASVIQAQFSQSAEMEADEYSVGFLKRNQYDPRGLVIALSRFRDIEAEGESGFMAQFVSSHPGAEARIDNVELVLAQKPPPPVLLAAAQEAEESNNATSVKEKPANVQVAKHEPVKLKAPEPQAVKAEKIQKAAPRSSDQVIGEGWYIQLAALPDQASAKDMQDALHERKVNAQIQSTVVNGAEYQRILVGPFPNKQKANEEVGHVSSHGIFEGEPFVRHLDN